jgi:3-hydroxyacyl-CoA dehydrogenase
MCARSPLAKMSIQMFDLVGLDVMGRDSEARTLMGDFVAAGWPGQKSGGGYYDYDENRTPSASDASAAHIRKRY